MKLVRHGAIAAVVIVTFGLSISINSYAASIDAEARKEADLLRDKTFTKCGDSFYTLTAGSVFVPQRFSQFRGPAGFVVEAYPIRVDDRANGVEWQGEVVMKPGLSRSSQSLSAQQQQQGLVLNGGNWGKWTEIMVASFKLRKMQGKDWEVGRDVFSDYKAISNVATTKPACSDLPK
jgi:hypothetical protein